VTEDRSTPADGRADGSGGTGGNADRSGRGQLVLVAAAALAVALVPLVLAYLGLGYHDDIHAGSGTAPAGQTETALDRALHDAADGVPSEYSWRERSAAVDTVRDRLAGPIASITAGSLDRGTAVTVGYNETRAARWAAEHCPGGPDRQFGACRADRGVIVQERDGRTHVLGAAFDVTVTTPDRELWFSTTVEHRRNY
jgi:hypothetical protein